jgi:hypothetical protein
MNLKYVMRIAGENLAYIVPLVPQSKISIERPCTPINPFDLSEKRGALLYIGRLRNHPKTAVAVLGKGGNWCSA